MRVLVSIDDTDNIHVKRGTGQLASEIAEAVEKFGWGRSEPVTRHQLLVHPDIPYTSHNSSMCFSADIQEEHLNDIIDYASDFLVRESAAGSDPGLCVVAVDRLMRPGWLIAFGYMAKHEVVTIEDAYILAEELGVHLSEHGGTGQGVIGALAGAGLRLSGNDGRFRGKIKIKADNDIASVREIRSQAWVDTVKCLEEGHILDENDLVMLGETVKTVLLDGKAVLLVSPMMLGDDQVQWVTCSKNQLKDY
ncbi:MAG: hypothetical protein GX964_09505 [Syntrophomonadaceae bacterium]|jgi:hypothetical protein|nr:hypothetical protein [Syntrophomonadaceae bacterium]